MVCYHISESSPHKKRWNYWQNQVWYKSNRFSVPSSSVVLGRVKTVRQFHRRVFLFDKLNLFFFKLQRTVLYCPIWQCGLFRIPFDITLTVSVCYQSCLSSCVWYLHMLSSWLLCNHKLRAASMKCKDSCFHRAQVLFVEETIVRNLMYILYLFD